MKSKTHLTVGTLISFPFIINNPISIIGLLACTFPDLDCKLGMKYHRTFTHSLLFLIFTTYITSLFSVYISIVWFICYSSHLVLDSITKTGIPLLYGLNRKYYGLKLVYTDGIFDNLLQLVCWLLFAYLLIKQIL